MTMSNRLSLGGAAVACAILAACSPSVSSLDCEEIADQAKQAGEGQAIRPTELRNLREENRTEREARCVGEATWSDNSTSAVYVRAYSVENGSTMVEYRNQPYDTPPAQ